MENKNTHQEVETKSNIGHKIKDFYARNIRFVDVVVLKNDQITQEHHGKSFHPRCAKAYATMPIGIMCSKSLALLD